MSSVSQRRNTTCNRPSTTGSRQENIARLSSVHDISNTPGTPLRLRTRSPGRNQARLSPQLAGRLRTPPTRFGNGPAAPVSAAGSRARTRWPLRTSARPGMPGLSATRPPVGRHGPLGQQGTPRRCSGSRPSLPRAAEPTPALISARVKVASSVPSTGTVATMTLLVLRAV